LALPALLAATEGMDRLGRHLHPFFQIQLAGLNGAFLTGDLFNLFVFFEVLLIASYALLVHGNGGARVRAGLHYVVLNLAGSLLFLVALGLLYGTLGTLNIADLASRVAALPEESEAPARAAFALLLAVFAFKAALLPLGFWLPHAYGAAAAPVAALFAVLTKVGIYAMLAAAPPPCFRPADWTAGTAPPWLMPVALGTVVGGHARRPGPRGAWRDGRASAAALDRHARRSGGGGQSAHAGGHALLPAAHHLVSAALFCSSADRRARGEGRGPDRACPAAGAWHALGAAWLVLGIAVTGPPAALGFPRQGDAALGRAGRCDGAAIWVSFILSGFVGALAMARAGSVVFWERPDLPPAAPTGMPALGPALVLALGFVPLLVLGAAPLSVHARAVAEQAAARQAYLAAAAPGPVARERRP
jgi:multicomponent K+:H+ antiporter subunit D